MNQGTLLVSRTDLKGIITYVNDEFVNISGFTRDELIGENHNIVRHPDMPPVEFKDLWLTIKALRPWQGLIKNRTKFSGYYWVETNVMPVFKNGKVHEYLSIQRVPSRTKVEKEKLLHALLNTDTAFIKPAALAPLVKAIKKTSVWKRMVKVFGNASGLNLNEAAGNFQCVLYSIEMGSYLAQAEGDVSKAMRVNQKQDKVHAGVIVANNHFEIIYMNNSLLETIKKALSNVDSFHKDPAGQYRPLTILKAPYPLELHIAGQVIKL